MLVQSLSLSLFSTMRLCHPHTLTQVNKLPFLPCTWRIDLTNNSFQAKQSKPRQNKTNTMAPSENDIRTLLSTQSYSAGLVQPLEEYLAAQTSGQAPYLFDAVRTLVKLYQLFPEHAKEDLTIRSYMLAMLEYPSTDNLALSYMIPQPILSTETCTSIQTCLSHLGACQFADFWTSYASLESSSDPVIAEVAKRSVPRMQVSILQVLALTYKEAPTSLVSKALRGIVASDIMALKSPVVKSVSAECVVFEASTDNTKREKVYQEGVSFATIGSLLSKISQ